MEEAVICPCVSGEVAIVSARSPVGEGVNEDAAALIPLLPASAIDGVVFLEAGGKKRILLRAGHAMDLERCGVLLDQRFFGTRDWYREGAEALMREQGPDGAFLGSDLHTAFALLFLKRATVPATTSPLD